MSATTTEPKALVALQTYMQELDDIGEALGLLSWDMEVMMPPNGAAQRSRQMATLSSLWHRHMVAPQVGEWLASLQEKETWPNLNEVQQAIVREVKRNYDEAVKLPESLVKELSQVTSEAHLLWVEARKNNQFETFAPCLKRIIELNQQKAAALGYEGSPYNALLDLYEPGLTTKTLEPLFAELAATLTPLLKAIVSSPTQPDTLFLSRFCDKDTQKALCKKVIGTMGFNWQAGRMDEAPHPFCSGNGPGDVRLTNRYFEQDWLSSLFSGLHEAGHGLYEQGIRPDLASTPLGGGVSLGIHESQSRLWENLVGRSQAFSQYLTPLLAQIAPQPMADVSAQQLYHALNRVRPSFIRVEADEVTYNLHVLLRYRLEKALIEGSLTVKDLPGAWNEAMQELLGLTPNTDTEGCLQDIHWAHGSFGYFPTYTIGNLASAQIFNTAQKAMPNLQESIAKGELLPLRQWLQENVHQYGKLYPPQELCQRVTGETLQSGYFINYLKQKYTALYAL